MASEVTMRSVTFVAVLTLVSVASARTLAQVPLSAAAQKLDVQCEKLARYTPAYAYCETIAQYLSESHGTPEEKTALGNLIDPTSDTANLASGYSERLLRAAAQQVTSNAQTAVNQVVEQSALSKQTAAPSTSNGSSSLVQSRWRLI
jgi:hypothetical protein